MTDRTYTILIDGLVDQPIVLTQEQMDSFIDAAEPYPTEPSPDSPEHPLTEGSGPGTITVSTSDGAPFTYRGEHIEPARAAWLFTHALTLALEQYAPAASDPDTPTQ